MLRNLLQKKKKMESLLRQGISTPLQCKSQCSKYNHFPVASKKKSFLVLSYLLKYFLLWIYFGEFLMSNARNTVDCKIRNRTFFFLVNLSILSDHFCLSHALYSFPHFRRLLLPSSLPLLSQSWGSRWKGLERGDLGWVFSLRVYSSQKRKARWKLGREVGRVLRGQLGEKMKISPSDGGVEEFWSLFSVFPYDWV